MRNKMNGFTLVELIVVIVILGILSAIAVPRYIDATKQARIATLTGLAGAIHSAVGLAKAAYQLTPGATVTMEGQTVAVTSTNPSYNGTPLATLAGIDKALSTSGFSAPTITAPTTTVGGKATWTVSGIATCSVTYTDSAATTSPSVYQVSVNQAGC